MRILAARMTIHAGRGRREDTEGYTHVYPWALPRLGLHGMRQGHSQLICLRDGEGDRWMWTAIQIQETSGGGLHLQRNIFTCVPYTPRKKAAERWFCTSYAYIEKW